MAAPEARSARAEPLRCPNDGARLVEIERSEVMIDACPECRGVWLDRGELDKILAKERAASAADPDQDFFDEVEGRRRRDRGEYRGDYEDNEDYRGGRKRRRRGILEDLLDFD
ncbi:MAG TPA: zf-TFIIB domain-containing protein [Gaiellaceae bacterium]|nr:zf-TFIIB domain-containing protein [Gaiellaceae bacterium]